MAARARKQERRSAGTTTQGEAEATKFSFLGLRRLGYMASPELPLVALAWARVDPSVVARLCWPPDQDDRRRVFRYESGETSQHRRILVASTRPASGTAPLQRFSRALARNSMLTPERADVLATACLDALRGVGQENKRGMSAVPVTLQSALLQDPAGLLGKANPPDFAAAFEEFWHLGGGPRGGVLDNLQRVHARITRGSGAIRQFLELLNRSLSEANVHGPFLDQPIMLNEGERDLSLPAIPKWWTPAIRNASPFSWFVLAWNRLCSDEWVDALPPRRWVDWASGVFRMATGMAYLWEAKALAALVRSSRRGDSWQPNWIENALALPILEWRDEGTVSARDVRGAMDALISTGEQLRDKLARINTRHELDSEGLWQYLAEACREPDFTAVLSGTGESLSSEKNLLETVRYALATRRSTTEDTDQYGFLELRGTRYWVPDPSTEWTAMIASLAAEGPGRTVRLREVRRSLRALGIEVSVPTLTRALEATGLTRGSSDAEQALLVSTAY